MGTRQGLLIKYKSGALITQFNQWIGSPLCFSPREFFFSSFYIWNVFVFIFLCQPSTRSWLYWQGVGKGEEPMKLFRTNCGSVGHSRTLRSYGNSWWMTFTFSNSQRNMEISSGCLDIYQTRVRSLDTLVTNLLTDWLTSLVSEPNCCWKWVFFKSDGDPVYWLTNSLRHI